MMPTFRLAAVTPGLHHGSTPGRGVLHRSCTSPSRGREPTMPIVAAAHGSRRGDPRKCNHHSPPPKQTESRYLSRLPRIGHLGCTRRGCDSRRTGVRRNAPAVQPARWSILLHRHLLILTHALPPRPRIPGGQARAKGVDHGAPKSAEGVCRGRAVGCCAFARAVDAAPGGLLRS